MFESSEGALIYQKYVEMLTLLDEYEDQIYYTWKSQVDNVCQFNLDQPLIQRNDRDGLLSVNFDPKVQCKTVLLSRLGWVMSAGPKAIFQIC